jgi:hypothetical protein
VGKHGIAYRFLNRNKLLKFSYNVNFYIQIIVCNEFISTLVLNLHIMKDKLKLLQMQLANIELAMMTILEKNGLDHSIMHEEWLDSADMKRIFHFSDSKLYRLRRDNLIAYSRIGNRLYYPKNYINAKLMNTILNKQ